MMVMMGVTLIFKMVWMMMMMMMMWAAEVMSLQQREAWPGM